MNGFQNYRTQLIEFVVQGTGTANAQQKIQFTDQPYLRNMPMYWLSAYNADDIPVSPQQNAVISAAQMAGCFLTLYTSDPQSPGLIDGKADSKWYDRKGEFFTQIPLIDLHNIQNADQDAFNRILFQLRGQAIYWEKSYITIGTAGGLGNTDNLSFLFSVGFAYGQADPTKPIQG
jgi:hypothetical protein